MKSKAAIEKLILGGSTSGKISEERIVKDIYPLVDIK